jgi:hypothetical protein
MVKRIDTPLLISPIQSPVSALMNPQKSTNEAYHNYYQVNNLAFPCPIT